MGKRAIAALAGIGLLACSAPLSWALQVPALRGRVNDYANMISPAAAARIEELSAELERSDSTQVVVLTVATLEGEDLEGFSIRVAEQWGIGQEAEDNGVLLLVAQQERAVRIEVGYGLEGRLTDLQSGRIIDHDIVPRFKAGDFDGGFVQGVQAITQAVRGEYVAKDRPASGGGAGGASVIPFIFLFFMVSAIGSRKRILGGVAGAVLTPLVALVALPLAPIFSLLFIPAGFLGGLLLPGIFPMTGGRGGRFRSGGGFGGGFSSGGFGGGGGGFSGGGGGFGGGGASGRW